MENNAAKKSSRRLSTVHLALCALFTALVAVGAFIQIPVPFMDYFTLQFFFVVLAGMLLGPRLGALSVAVYVALGLIGVPILRGGRRNRVCPAPQLRLPAWLHCRRLRHRRTPPPDTEIHLAFLFPGVPWRLCRNLRDRNRV